ncbi:hypothetical protein [Acinetobacter stercoris]|uniref:Uncharacterized protein n=1 Tax=Acinetobacter stercoris TaxID=2126983 RepID=A0A2U3MUD1_9GAMM|nr:MULTISPECIES: hypothetical protein [Acinetobacter]SPL69022.1 hypothetical protein KPC_0200 [Acinetobacter stercoris]
MNLKAISISLICLCTTIVAHAAPSELDQYLIKKQYIDTDFKIKNQIGLKDLLSYLSDEDSRTLPLQIDQNTLIEKLRLHTDHIEIQGIITTPDFNQFEKDIGEPEVKSLLKRNILENCSIIFEHEFQRNNPYYADIKLSSEHHQYIFKISNQQCRY